ncbi:MAG: hypothetical protein IPM29_16600 [Planctomycetes bacterium]|nr:hypothetical protein [Planctomycetota bacterium]
MRALLARFYRRQADDVLLGFFFAGRDLDAIAAGQLAFLRWATGDVDALSVRHPKDAHTALPPILRGHFDRRLVLLRETLEAGGVAAEDIEVWLRLERAMRRHVVRSHPF